MGLFDILIIIFICYIIYYLFFQDIETDKPLTDDLNIENNTELTGNITNNKLCLDSKFINNKKYIIPTTCNLQSNQIFNYSPELNTIKNISENEKCFYVNTENKVELKNCNNSESQTFIYNIKDKLIQVKNLDNKCLQNTNLDSPIIISTCNPNSKQQIFEFNGDRDINSIVSLSLQEKCLEVKNKNYTNGELIQLNECNYDDNQKFIYNSKDRQFKVFKNQSKCLDHNYITKKIDIWDCNNLPTQTFIYDQLENIIKLENKCLSAKNETNNNELDLVECKPNTENENQKIIMTPIINNITPTIDTSIDTDQTGNITIYEKCMNIPNLYALSNIKPNLEKCNLTKNQNFEYNANSKQITTGLDKNKCLNIGNGNLNNIIDIQNCNNSNSQKFIYDQNNKLLKTEFNKSRCIEYKNNNFLISECDLNNNNQKFNFNNNPTAINGTFSFNIKNKCLYSNNNTLQTADCDSVPQQKFNYSSNDGTIKSVASSNKCMDAKNTNTLYMQDCNNTNSQKFIYDLTTQQLKNNNKCVNLNNNNFNLQTCNNKEEQQFNISTDSKDISYQNGYIVNKNKCIDLNSGNTNNGAKINIWKCDNSDRQQFEYSPEDFTIKYSKNNKKCLDIRDKSQLNLWDCNNSDNQKFYYNTKDKQIKLYSDPNKCIDLKYNDNTNGNTYQAINCKDGNSAQEFEFNSKNYIKDYYGNIMIRDKCIDIKDSKTNNGTKVQINECNNSNAQNFKYSTTDKLIRSEIDNNKCLDFNGSKIYLYDCHGQNNQQFIYIDDTQQLKQNDKCMDLNRDDNTNGTEFGLISCKDNHQAQKFFMNSI